MQIIIRKSFSIMILCLGLCTKALEHILFWSDKAQRGSNLNPFIGDLQDDVDAINAGGEAWKRDNNIV